MEIYALSGPSGTGKSDSALLVAHNHQIPAIIDDGLLIYKGQKYAGTSAKYETNSITAVKRATFYYNDHREEVIAAIEKIKPSKILLLGTSVKMVRYIASKLNLGEINHYIDIYDVRSSMQIKMALFVRKTQGKHVVPVPSFQIEQGFFKKMITKGTVVFSKNKRIGEKTIVQPNFQTDGIIISTNVFISIVSNSVKQMPDVESFSQVKISLGDIPRVSLQVSLKTSKEKRLMDTLEQLQAAIKKDFQFHFNIELYSIDIFVTKLTLTD